MIWFEANAVEKRQNQKTNRGKVRPKVYFNETKLRIRPETVIGY